MAKQISRRAFLGQAATAPAAGMAREPTPAEQPKQAWVILRVGWEYNDEYSYPEGAQALPKIYFDRPEAEAECQRLCQKFFREATPLDFEVDFEFYRGVLAEDVTEETATWEQLCSAGFPAPYYLQEMET